MFSLLSCLLYTVQPQSRLKSPPKDQVHIQGEPVHLIQVSSVTHHRMSNLGSDIIIYNETPSWFCNWVWLSIAQVLWVEEWMSAIRLLSHGRVWRTETSEAGGKISFNFIDCMYSNFILSRLDHYSYCLITCIKKELQLSVLQSLTTDSVPEMSELKIYLAATATHHLPSRCSYGIR